MFFNVEQIAKLAKIKISEDEKIILEKSIESIIKMFDKLNEVDLHMNLDKTLEEILLEDLPEMRYREDKEDVSMSNEELISNSPQSTLGCIVVPKIVE